MLNAEPNTTLDILSEDGSHHTSIVPTVSSNHHPSPRRSAGSLSQSPLTAPLCRSVRTFGNDARSHPPIFFHARPDAECSGPVRPASAGEPLRPRERDSDDVRNFTVMVAEELPNSRYVLGWHDPRLCSYEEQVWSPCLARTSGRCALSGKRIHLGDSVYRPRTRGRVMPLNGHVMILTSELVKARTGA
jgi:hypothetical protein